MPTENLLCLRRGCAFAVSLSCLLAPARAGDSQRPEVSWIESTPLPEPRDGFAAGILGDELIVAGGTYWSGTHGNWQQKQFARGVHAFNPQKAVWRALPQAPVSFGYPASAALGGRLFVLGGLHDGAASGDVYSLQPTAAASAWEREPPMPEPRIFATAVAYGTCLYVIGGTR
jgi:N-acetylneuraminic acid mutarotase